MAAVEVIVGTAKGAFIYRSDSARKIWTASPALLPGWDVYSVHRDSYGRVIAGTSHFAYGATFRASDDGGKTWEQLPARPEYPKVTGWEMKRIWQIAGHPTERDTLYAGVEEAGLFVSKDRGTTWSEIESLTRTPARKNWFPGGGGLCLHTIVVDPKNPKNIYIGISAVGVFRTRDGGQTWTNHNQSLSKLPTGSPDPESACCVHKMVIDPRDSTRLFMQFHGGVYRSIDSAETWQHIETGLPGNFGFPIAITHRGELFVIPLHSDGQRFFADETTTIYRSKDNGDSWQPLRGGFPQQPSFASVLRDSMAVDTFDVPGVYFGTSSGEVFASPDAGESWQRLPGTLPRINCVRAYVV